MKKIKKVRKARHNIYLSDESDWDAGKIVIKGNNLELRWIDNSILIFSKNLNEDILQNILKIIKEGITKNGK